MLGGSFNPAHEGHNHVSVEALRRLALDEVWWLVSPQNPLKSEEEMAPFEDRVTRARAVARHPRIRVTTFETQLGTRFTVDTLRRLRKNYPATSFVWVMGADNLADFTRWHQWSTIFETVPIAVFARQSYDFKALNSPAAVRFRSYRLREAEAGELAGRSPPAWVFVPMRPHPASATELRRDGAWPPANATRQSVTKGERSPS
ncbi:MAG: nicotinate-nucleotide adenylyltransferase [Alphaproteobacteria bacterium]